MLLSHRKFGGFRQKVSFAAKRIGCALFLLFIILPGNAKVNVHNGSVVSLKFGSLERIEGAKWVSLSQGSAVALGDRLRTDKKAVSIVHIPGKGRFVIGPNTDMKIGSDTKEFSALMSKGAVWIDADELPTGRGLSITTPQATTGVRGTKFSVLSDEKGGAVCTCEGLVEVRFSDTDVVPSAGKHFVEIGEDGSHPDKAQPDLHLLRRKRKDRYEWCFTCHEVGKRGELIKDWDRI